MGDGEVVEQDATPGFDDGRTVPGDQEPERSLRDTHADRCFGEREKGRAAPWFGEAEPRLRWRSRRLLSQANGTVTGHGG